VDFNVIYLWGLFERLFCKVLVRLARLMDVGAFSQNKKIASAIIWAYSWKLRSACSVILEKASVSSVDEDIKGWLG
jgi:hypothetical protein